MIRLGLKLGFKKIGGVKTLGLTMADGLKGNSHFPDPEVSPAELEAAVAEVQTEETTILDLKADIAAARGRLAKKQKNLKLLITKSATSCLARVAADPDAEAKLMSAKIPLRADNRPAQKPSAELVPQNLRGTYGRHAGSVDLRWEPHPDADGYVGEYRVNGSELWIQFYIGTKASATADKLKSGEEHTFHVAALKGGDRTEWSDVFVQRAR